MTNSRDELLPRTVLAVTIGRDFVSRERAYDQVFLVDSMKRCVERVETFWFDDYMHDLPDLQARLIAKVRELQPDLVFFTMYRDEFDTATLDLIKDVSPSMVWFGDDQWRFEGHSRRYAPHFTHVVTTDPRGIDRYRQIGIEPLVSQWAAQELTTEADATAYIRDVSFVGGASPYRTWLISWLRRQGMTVDAFGPGFAEGRVSFERIEEIFRTSRINLNISNSANADIRYILSRPFRLLDFLRSTKRAEQIKARNFEIPMSGGFQLTNYAAGLERYFVVGDEVAIYASPEDCLDQIRYYLEHESEREEIRVRGVVTARARHSWDARFRELFQSVWL